MKKSVAALSAAVMLVVPSSAVAHDGGSLKHKNRYLRAQVIKLGASPGRDVVKYGVRKGKDASVHEYLETMRRMIAPPPPPPPAPVAAPAAYTPAAPAQSSTSSGGWAIPEEIVMCESGGDYNAVNKSSGARGAYQLMPSTYYGAGGDGSWSPADQDRVAARVWAGGAGRGNWVC